MTMKSKGPSKAQQEIQSTHSKMKVEHDYHDYSHVAENSDFMKEFYETSANAFTPHKGEQNFPVKLHYMLSELEADGLDCIVSWQSHGRCFLVHDQNRFVEETLPMWFRQSKFASFQRQLNLYGFKRLTSGRDKGGYYHECFLRGKRFLAYRIERIKIKGTGARKPGSPETEPNFYLSPFLPHILHETKRSVMCNNTDIEKLVTADKFTSIAPFDTVLKNFGSSTDKRSNDEGAEAAAALQRYLLTASLGEAVMSAATLARLSNTTSLSTPSSTSLLLEAQNAQLSSNLFMSRPTDYLALQGLCPPYPGLPLIPTASPNTTLHNASSNIVSALLQLNETGQSTVAERVASNTDSIIHSGSSGTSACFENWLLSLTSGNNFAGPVQY